MTPSATYVLAMLPVGVFGLAAIVPRPAPAPEPLQVKLVKTEGVRVVRLDSRTFRDRWMPVHEFPPAIEVRHSNAEQVASSAGAVVTTLPPNPPPSRRLRERSARLDVCERHGMRRVDYFKNGRKHWRCRR